jgi:hypothetical protein
MKQEKFGTAVNCMDGRVQRPVMDWMTAKYDVDFVDMVTEPGPDKILTEGPEDRIALIRDKIAISVEKHGSRVVAVTAHDDCAGNPVPQERHLDQVKKSMQVIKSWGFPVEIVGLWLCDTWRVEVVDTIPID